MEGRIGLHQDGRGGFEPGWKGWEDGPRTGNGPGFMGLEDIPGS